MATSLIDHMLFTVSMLESWKVQNDYSIGGGYYMSYDAVSCSYYCKVYIITAPQHLVCRVVPSLHINHMQMSIIEVFICRRLHMNTSMILICIWLICRLGTTLHAKCCGAVYAAKCA